MELVPAFSRGGDEGDTKTASPIPEEIREARSSVVLIRPQLRIGKHVDWHEEESVSQPLISPGQSGSEREFVGSGILRDLLDFPKNDVFGVGHGHAFRFQE